MCLYSGQAANGQYLSDIGDYSIAMRYLEEGKASFEEQKILDQEYYKCSSCLGNVYLSYYLQDRNSRLTYLRKARTISRMLQDNRYDLGTAYNSAKQLKANLEPYGKY